jgi:hypothetical protein
MAKFTAPAMPRLLMAEIDLCGWLGQAAPDDRLEYHRGFLAADIDARSGRLAETERRELVQLARRAYWASQIGRAHLVQRRHGPCDYSYLLIARPNPKTSPVSLSSLLLEPMENL